jgi:hypothetical protein
MTDHRKCGISISAEIIIFEARKFVVIHSITERLLVLKIYEGTWPKLAY